MRLLLSIVLGVFSTCYVNGQGFNHHSFHHYQHQQQQHQHSPPPHHNHHQFHLEYRGAACPRGAQCLPVHRCPGPGPWSTGPCRPTSFPFGQCCIIADGPQPRTGFGEPHVPPDHVPKPPQRPYFVSPPPQEAPHPWTGNPSEIPSGSGVLTAGGKSPSQKVTCTHGVFCTNARACPKGTTPLGHEASRRCTVGARRGVCCTPIQRGTPAPAPASAPASRPSRKTRQTTGNAEATPVLSTGRATCPTRTICTLADACPGGSTPVLEGPTPRQCTVGRRRGLCCASTPRAMPAPASASGSAPKLSSTTPQTTGRTEATAGTPSGRACQEIRSLQFRKRRELQRAPILQVSNVFGGERAFMAEFPYMVAVGYAGANSNNNTALLWGCGGSLISERYALSAAHCITDAREQKIRPVVLRLGVNTLVQGPRVESDYAVESFTLHPKHQAPRKYFDLALLRTDRPVTFGASVHPVCLPPADFRVDSGTKLVVAGWGATDRAGYAKSADLKKAELQYVPLEECKVLVPTTSGIPRGLGDDMMCVADPNRESDACRGDSGGPLVARVDGEDTLVGVTSFGGNPCASRIPSVYSRTAPELSWIESIVWP